MLLTTKMHKVGRVTVAMSARTLRLDLPSTWFKWLTDPAERMNRGKCNCVTTVPCDREASGTSIDVGIGLTAFVSCEFGSFGDSA